MKGKLSTNKAKNLKFKQEINQYIQQLNDEQKLKFWIKTLLSSYSTLPEILKTLDKIIELQASSISFISDIYNREKSTFNQVEKVIDLSERKNNLLNIYVMIKKLLNNLSITDSDFLEKRFVYNWSTEELASEFNISCRTVYRKIDKLISTIYANAIENRWSLKFLESQIKNEEWLKDRFLKQVGEYYKVLNFKTNHNQSSSESYFGKCG